MHLRRYKRGRGGGRPCDALTLGRLIDREAGKQIDRQAGRQAGRQTGTSSSFLPVSREIK